MTFDTRSNLVLQEGLQLANTKWKRNIAAINEGFKRAHGGKTPDPNILATTALMLENTDNMIRKMDETTRVVNLGNFVDYGFGVITAVMPSLVAHEIVSVQPLKARTGVIFYLDFKYGSNKGGARRGDSMISPFTGAAGDFDYTSERVSGEEIYKTADSASAVDIQTNLSYLPVRRGTVQISDGLHTLIDDGNGNLKVEGSTWSEFSSGKIDYESGAVEISLTGSSEGQLVASYEFDFRNQDLGANIPEVDITLGSETITTTTRKLRARWLFDAAYELKETHGIDADSELTTAIASEIKHEIDGEIMRDLLQIAKAGNTQFTWSKTPGTGVAFVDHKDTFIDLLIRMSNAIFQDTRRAEGNYIIAGINVCSIIESLGGRFIPETNGLKAGPHVVGTLDGRWKIIKNPYYDPDEFIIGYKGQSYLEGGYVYAPYLPLYATPTMMLDDFVARKGMASTYGKKALNPRFYAKGKITE